MALDEPVDHPGGLLGAFPTRHEIDGVDDFTHTRIRLNTRNRIQPAPPVDERITLCRPSAKCGKETTLRKRPYGSVKAGPTTCSHRCNRGRCNGSSGVVDDPDR